MARRSRRYGIFKAGYRAKGKQPAWRRKFVKQSKACARKSKRKGSFHKCMRSALRGKHA